MIGVPIRPSSLGARLFRWVGLEGVGAGPGPVVGFVTPTMRVEVYADTTFTSPMNVTSDLSGSAGLRLRYGIEGNSPVDRVAGTGECSYALKNDAGNSGGLQGYYSPGHTNVRSGWTFGKFFRVIFTYDATDYIKFTGTVRAIDPEPGRYRGRLVNVTGYDSMRDLAEANAREVAIQVDKADDELLDALYAVMPPASLPVSTSFDAGADLFPYAFDNVGGDSKVLAVMRDVVVSSFGLLFAKGNGQLRYLSRHSIAVLESDGEFTDDELSELSVPSTLDSYYDRARATTHPKVVSATATDELYTIPAGSAVELPDGATVEPWTDYTDPNDRQTRIGGTAVETTLVAGVHYAANAQADGLGADMTANISATIDPFGTTAKWTIVNSGPTAFLTTQKVIGKAVRDPGPQTFESPMGATGVRPIEFDLPYQDDPFIGQSAADYVVATYSIDQQVNGLAFIANKSDALMRLAMEKEPGDLITISEDVTGLEEVTAIIQSVEFEVQQSLYIVCRWGLRPHNDSRFWQLGIAGASELGDTTVLGF